MRSIRADQLVPWRIPEHPLQPQLSESAAATIAGVTLELRTNVAGLAAAFASRYCDHPQGSPPDFIYNVVCEDGGYTMWCEHESAWRWPHSLLPLSAVLFLADAAAIAALVHFDPGLASMHAAGVHFRGIAAAICADSEGGKTTTALACAHAGMRVYSDERVLLRERVVLPFLRRCSVRPGSVRLLHTGDGTAFAHAVKDPAGASWTEAFGKECIAPPAPLAAAFLICGKGALEIAPTEPTRVLAQVLRWFDCRDGGMQRVSRALSLLSSLQCYTLTLGTPDETASAIAGVLSRLAAA